MLWTQAMDRGRGTSQARGSRDPDFPNAVPSSRDTSELQWILSANEDELDRWITTLRCWDWTEERSRGMDLRNKRRLAKMSTQAQELFVRMYTHGEDVRKEQAHIQTSMKGVRRLVEGGSHTRSTHGSPASQHAVRNARGNLATGSTGHMVAVGGTRASIHTE